MSARTAALTAVALVAFAANSWLCRAALRGGAIDPASFTAVRLLAGAIVLVLLARRGGGAAASGGSWGSAAALAVYALAFSLAYLELDAGVGALVLFGAVQLTMLAGGLLAGERPRAGDLAGMALALAGLVLLAAPGGGGVEPLAVAGMAAAGAAWGIYSLRGRGARRPLAANAVNFARAAPVALGALGVAAALGAVRVTASGLLLATVSGAITSGLGYAVWYAALRGLDALRAGLVQLAVPVIAALGGVALLGEALGARLAGSGVLVLGGIALATVSRRR